MLDVQEKRETLLRAAEMLAPVLPGFHFRVVACGCGAGGAFAHGEFSLGQRRLILLIRYRSLLVIYRLGQAAVTHHEYREALSLGQESLDGPSWFSGPVLSALSAVKRELAQYGEDFVHGSGEQFLRIAAGYAARQTGPVVLSCFQKLGAPGRGRNRDVTKLCLYENVAG